MLDGLNLTWEQSLNLRWPVMRLVTQSVKDGNLKNCIPYMKDTQRTTMLCQYGYQRLRGWHEAHLCVDLTV